MAFFHLVPQGQEITLSKITKGFPNALPGKTVIIEKTFDPKTKRIGIRSNHESITNADALVALERAETKLIREKNGAMAPAMAEKLAGADDTALVLAVVSLKHPEGVVYLDKFKHSPEELRENSLSIANLKPLKSGETVLRKYQDVRILEDGDFSLVISASRATLMRMAFDEDIGSLSLYEVPKSLAKKGGGARFLGLSALWGQSSINLRTLARSAYSHSQSPLPSNLASGVRAATFETGLNAVFLSCAGITPAAYDPMTVPFTSLGSGAGDSVHSLVTFTNLFNAAPGGSLYHRRSWTYQNSADRNFIINNQLATISMSTDVGQNSANSAENRAVDAFANIYPYPVFSNPTANDGWRLPPRWAAYNALSVGNVQDSAYTHFKIDTITCGGGATQTRNPNPVYGGCIDGGTYPNCAGDREMPYIVAPGYTPFANISLTTPCYMLNVTPMTSNCISQGQEWGTSMSAPTLNGMAASLMGRNPYLKNNPELVRAILLQTARNVHGGLWNWREDGKDGAGVVHGASAIAFATNLPWTSPGNTPIPKAYSFLNFCQTDFGGNGTKTYNISIPNPKPAGQHLRVVLTWNSFPDLVNNENRLPDVDISLSSNIGNRTSSSWDANVEILDIPAVEFTAGGNYSLDIVPYMWRRTAGANANCSYAALTWGFTTTQAR